MGSPFFLRFSWNSHAAFFAASIVGYAFLLPQRRLKWRFFCFSVLNVIHRPEYPAHLSLVLRCDLAFGQFQQLLHSEVGAQSFDFFVGYFDVEFFFQVH